MITSSVPPLTGGDADAPWVRVTVSWTFPAPTQFWWLPVARYRHAIWDRERTAAEGTPVHTLCGETHTRSAVGDYDWFWPSCPPCWEATCTLVGLRSDR